MRKRLGLWITLFVLLIICIFVLATSWNILLLQQHLRMTELAKRIATREFDFDTPIWLPIACGTVGFMVVLGFIITFFVKLIKEMQVNNLHREFLAKISHELRSPISTLELSSGLLQHENLSAEDRGKLWSSFDAELKRLKVEVDLLIKAARLEFSSFKAQLVDVEMEAWLESSVLRWTDILGPGARLERSGDPFHFQGRYDPKLLELVTNNLVDNARKFSQPGPCLLKIRSEIVNAEGGKGRIWRLHFQDAGLGFEGNETKKIFQKFYRANKQNTHAIAGNGLGLYLVKSACRAMKIKILAASPGLGKGATFTLEGAL